MGSVKDGFPNGGLFVEASWARRPAGFQAHEVIGVSVINPRAVSKITMSTGVFSPFLSRRVPNSAAHSLAAVVERGRATVRLVTTSDGPKGPEISFGPEMASTDGQDLAFPNHDGIYQRGDPQGALKLCAAVVDKVWPNNAEAWFEMSRLGFWVDFVHDLVTSAGVALIMES